jgi:hypothetical protein
MIGKFPKVGPRVYGGAPLSPFAGVYTWWANMNNATFSNSGGVDYVDTIPLTGISDSFVQPTAAQRPRYIASGLNGNATMQATISNQKIYKATDASVFNGGGTFAFVHYNTGGNTYFTEATATASAYNFQILVAAGDIRFYTPIDGNQILTLASPIYNTWCVHHFAISGTTLKYYQNGGLVATITVTQNMSNARPLTAYNYKSINAEQGLGQFGDIVAFTGTALNGTQVANDYTNFWKVKYPSLP